jgi:Flp pilus assembly protein TadG
MFKIRNFLGNQLGNTGIMFSLAAVPMLLAAGAGIDMVRANQVQTVLQGAADAAALAGGTSKKTDPEQYTNIVKDFLAQNGANDALDSIDAIDVTLDSETGVFRVSIQGKMETGLMFLAGISTLDVGAVSEVALGSQALEVVLVLDNTASMNSEGRLDALKTSAKDLVTTLLRDKPSDMYLKIGIVPFGEYVNVGVSNRNASWIDVPADTTTTTNVCSVTYPDATSSNCHTENGTWNNDGVPTPYTYEVCDWNYGNPVTTCADQTWTNTWYGCVGSRESPLDKSIGTLSTRYPGLQNTSCVSPITPLSDVESELHTKIDAMIGNGETYIPAGLLWGWNLIDSKEPLTGAKTKSQMSALRGTKAVVLMTDGDNTRSAQYIYHWGNDTVAADQLTADLCSNIKGDNITLYTVAFKVAKASSKSMLEACASDSSKSFDAEDNAALQASFETIAASLSQIRLAR